MNGTSRLALPWAILAAAAVALPAIGAGTTYWMLRPSPRSQIAAADHGATSGTQSPPPDVAVSLTPEAVQRARIVVGPVVSARDRSALRLPAVVEPNAYKQVTVTPLVAGRITRVFVELGQAVRRGQAMAEIFSPELAEAETRYISARAELDAHERELQRTEKLVAIGAASRQELERLHAEHTARLAGVESSRSRLELLGLSAPAIVNLAPGDAIGGVTTVPAPMTGVVTERAANTGLNVDTAGQLFTVVDFSTVWVVADLYEKDFRRVIVGSSATVTTKAYPDGAFHGRVSYIDPQVNPQTRTAKVRIEVPNPGNELRLGMYADVSVDGSGQDSVIVIPRRAVQSVGDRSVVYLADSKQPGRFTEREVRLGEAFGDQVSVLDGLREGDTIVTDGSFSVRAERERLSVRPDR
jgi:cobalt-zinc-cadmium efflux system membrane fusion protein